MKALKLIIIGLVALGALVGIFYLINPTTKTIILPPVDDETFENYSQEFQNDWEGVGDWDENVFNRHRETLNMLSTDYSVEELVNFERSSDAARPVDTYVRLRQEGHRQVHQGRGDYHLEIRRRCQERPRYPAN